MSKKLREFLRQNKADSEILKEYHQMLASVNNEDALLHDLGVIVFAGIYMGKMEAESLRTEEGGEAYNTIKMSVEQMEGKYLVERNKHIEALEAIATNPHTYMDKHQFGVVVGDIRKAIARHVLGEEYFSSLEEIRKRIHDVIKRVSG